jgi:DHA2 family multidrug resistance protein
MSDFRLWLGFIAMCIGVFMAVLDIQVVASALTTMGAALSVAPEKLGWVQTGYLMAEVIAIPLTGLLTRALSLRWMFVMAILGFTLASLGCALSGTILTLIVLRAVQGFFGGMLIPAVFTSIFVMMPPNRHILATTLAGLFAVIAPTVGPFVGGYLTQHLSWHWIFLVNVGPGLLIAVLVGACVRVGKPNLPILKSIDYVTLILMAVFLATLELLLSEAPGRDWHGRFVYGAAILCAISCVTGFWRALTHPRPFIDLRCFRRRSFALGCGLSFIFGMGLFGSVYMLAIFLGLVRGHTPLEIGEILMVSGAAQLVMAPVAALLEKYMDARLLTGIGFAVFGLGMGLNGIITPQSDFWELFWPQILRGLAVLVCILPATRLALDGWAEKDVPDASGLFNLTRNLGGAIGIALIDTLVQTRTAGHADALIARLQTGDIKAAQLVGLPTAMFQGHAMGPVDAFTRAVITPMIQRAALTQSLNEGWLVITALFVVALLMVPMIKRT